MAITADRHNVPAHEPQAQTTSYSTTPAVSNGHIVHMPKGFIAVRILQLIFAILVLALSGFLMNHTYYGTYPQESLGLFSGLFTIIIVVYDLVAESGAQAAYNMWAVLSLDILATIFWLSSMASLAALRATFTVPVVTETCDMYGNCYTKEKRDIATDGYLDVLAVDVALAAVALILFIISLIMFSAALHRHNSGNSNVVTAEKMETGQTVPVTAATVPEYQPPPQQPMHAGVSPVSPIQHTQIPYQATTNPAPAYTPPMQQTFAEAPTYEGKA